MDGVLKKKWFNRLSKRSWSLILVAAGFAAVLFYMTCMDACAGIAGTMAGIDLEFVGLGYLAVVGFGVLLQREAAVFGLLSAGVGGELYLVGYQVRTGDFCPFCMVFGAVVVGLFLMQFDRRRARLLALIPAGLLAMWVSFDDALPAYGAAPPAIPVYGNGSVELRIYTDYFCGPCSRIEPEMEALLLSLVEQGRVRVRFIDVPLQRHTPMYAKQFLSRIGQGHTIHDALRLRRHLFNDAANAVVDLKMLESGIQSAGFPAGVIDIQPLLSECNAYFKKDNIRSTPTLVVDRGETTDTFTGGGAILKALKQLGPTPK